MRATVALGLATFALTALGCGDDDRRADATLDAGADPDGGETADAEPDAPFEPTPPAEAALPVMTPCPPGWREIAGVDGTPAVCEPWPEGGREACAPYEAHYPGAAGCTAVGDPCPATGDFSESLPADRRIWFVRAGAPSGGDGTREAPFDSLSGAIAIASDGDVVALASGIYSEPLRIEAGVTLWGACAARTEIATTLATGDIETRGTGVGLRNLRITGAFARVFVLDGSIDVRGVVVEAGELDVLAIARGDLTAWDVRITTGGTGSCVYAGGFGNAIVERMQCAAEGFALNANGSITVRDSALVAAVDETVEPQPFVLAEAGTFLLERVAIEGERGAGLHLATFATLRDVVIRGSEPTAPRDDVGILSLGGGQVTLERVRVERSVGFGAGVAGDLGASSIELRDVVVRDVAPSFFGAGAAISAESGGQLTGGRVYIAGAPDVGLMATEPGTSVSIEDLTIVGGRGVANGTLGRGVQVQRGAAFTASRVRLERNREAGVIVSSTTASFSDLVVRATLERACAATTCAGFGAGIGIGAYEDGVAEVVRFVSEDNALAGVQIARRGAIDLHDGLVANNPVGANVQEPAFDLSRLEDRVAWRGNGTRLDVEALPVPEPAL